MKICGTQVLLLYVGSEKIPWLHRSLEVCPGVKGFDITRQGDRSGF